METKFCIFNLLLSLFFVLHQVQADGSLFFLESGNQRFFRPESKSQDISFASSDFADAISVLLGFSPSSSPSSASKLDGLLVPNAFDRPRNVLILVSRGIDADLLKKLDLPKLGLSAGSQRKLVTEISQTDVQLPEDEVMIESFNNLDSQCEADCIVKKLKEVASWLGGTLSSERESVTISIPENLSLPLNLNKQADKTFAEEIISLQQKFKAIVAEHENSSDKSLDLPVLLMGSFNGVQALREYYDNDEIVLNGAKLFLRIVAKLLEVQSIFDGQFVGVISTNDNAYSTSTELFNVKLFANRRRWLTEIKSNVTEASLETTIAQIVLVRTTIAWSAGIVLLLATILGVLFLFNMPLTRDTLLYSNVKLD